MTNHIDFSFIIPVYNAESVIPRIVSQILEVSGIQYEIILVNDGSNDKSRQIIDSLTKKHKEVIAVHQKNQGPSAARNNGIIHARGEFLLFCDADDEIHSNSLQNILDDHLSKKHTSDMTVFGWEIVQKNSDKILNRRTITIPAQHIKSPSILEKTVKSLGEDGRLYNLWNKIYRRSLVKKYTLRLREDLRFGEDLLFNLDFLSHVKNVEMSDHPPYYIYEEDSPTSIVNGSKLDYTFRLKNTEALEDFANQKNNKKINDYVLFVKWRWLISYILSLSRTSWSLRKKRAALKKMVYAHALKPSNQAHILTKKQLCIEYIFYIGIKMPALFLISLRLYQRIRPKKQKHTIVHLAKI